MHVNFNHATKLNLNILLYLFYYINQPITLLQFYHKYSRQNVDDSLQSNFKQLLFLGDTSPIFFTQTCITL